jgi:hypothetical protein
VASDAAVGGDGGAEVSAANEKGANWPDIGYAIRATAGGLDGDGGPYWIEFKVYTLCTINANGYGYQRDGSHFSPDVVDTLDEAEVFLRGSVKWDGCANFTFEEASAMLHTCGREDMATIGKLLVRVHDFCGHMLTGTRDFNPEPLP